MAYGIIKWDYDGINIWDYMCFFDIPIYNRITWYGINNEIIHTILIYFGDYIVW